MSYQTQDPRRQKDNINKIQTNTSQQNNNIPKTKEELHAEELLRRAKERDKEKSEKRQEKIGPNGEERGIAAFLRGTRKELKATTWPTKGELIRWCLIVIATVTIFAVLAMLIDNFVATPLMYWISSLEIGSPEFGWIDILLVVGLFITGTLAVIGIMLHQGGETEGLSDTLASKISGGSSQVQKNLDRITLVCIILFLIILILMMIAYPQGTIVGS